MISSLAAKLSLLESSKAKVLDDAFTSKLDKLYVSGTLELYPEKSNIRYADRSEKEEDDHVLN